MTCEIIGGFWAKSLAIVTDAAHLKLLAEVLGAFFSVFLIWIVTGVLVVLAILRMINKDYDIDSTVMAITATIGVGVNLIMGVLLYFGGHSHSHGGGSSHGHSHGHRDDGGSAEHGRPNNIDFSNVFTSLEQINGVKKVHDLRIWALTMDKVAVSVHLEVAEPEHAQSVLRDTRAMLKKEYGVHESTIQIEGFVAEKDCDLCDVPK
ncbi:cation efflux family protein [Ancylostoma ceylanicum]|uniref:Cation efflux family protein n=1 Tax=Ancylostoma ceylanicum TaxID=53326 RepID=A0A0D6MCX7_9BILA|nr:cation efflux family protein [Ancylostoma ceylanicum]